MEVNNIPLLQDISVNRSTNSNGTLGRETKSLSGDGERPSQNSSSSLVSDNSRFFTAPAPENIQDISTTAVNITNEEASARLREAVQEVERFINTQNRDLAFSLDDRAQRQVVTVKDSSSGDVIRQIPSDEVLKMAERIRELQEDVGSRIGVFLDSKA